MLVLAVGGAVYFYIDQNNTRSEIAAIDTADYSSNQLSAEKGEKSGASGFAISVRTDEALNGSVYETPLGFPIISYSEKWTGEKLVDIYNELLNNVHGDEIMNISQVVVNPGGSDLTAVNVAGTHSRLLEYYQVFFDMPSIVPLSLSYKIESTLSVLNLYKMDDYDTVEQAARTIAHEYGHHYTMYYFMYNDDEALASPYYTLRGFGEYGREVVFDTEEAYYANYEWSIYEIAAEDYVQLMGSPNAKQAKEYLDVYDVLVSYNGDEYSSVADDTTVNVFPQNNIYIPLADEVPGLTAYFYSFIEEENVPESLEPADFELSMQKKENFGMTYYNITWSKPCTDAGALYTLVCYDTDGHILMPVRTVYGDETAVARVGTVSRRVGSKIQTCTNSITDEDRYFKVYLVWPDGRMQSSELFHADF